MLQILQKDNAGSSTKILVVDDELVSRKKLELLIQSLGYDTLVAEDGIAAWEIWKNKMPKIVITDWIMPGMDGPELCRRIRAAEGSQYTFVIIVTSKSEVHDIVSGMDAGADDFITKPFMQEELAVRIRAGERILGYLTRDIVIFSMAKLAESRDLETGNHLERIRYYAKTLAAAIVASEGSPSEVDNLFIENIFLTSPLHDIGKIGIPDYVLQKPGRYDNKDLEIMKTHCQIGYQTISEALKRYPKADYLRMSSEIALSHHEKFDGTGYPSGLKADEIPFSARIVALSDVYDALVTKRVYKDAYPHEMAKAMIIGEKGKHFDPMVVEAFLSCEETFLEILDQFGEE